MGVEFIRAEWTRTEREHCSERTLSGILFGEFVPWWEARMVLKWYFEEAHAPFLLWWILHYIPQLQNQFGCSWTTSQRFWNLQFKGTMTGKRERLWIYTSWRIPVFWDVFASLEFCVCLCWGTESHSVILAALELTRRSQNCGFHRGSASQVLRFQ